MNISDIVHADNLSPQRPVPLKKVRVVKAKVSKVAKKVFKELPIDLLAQICSHAHPASLLALSCTNKSFRSYLVLPSSEKVWIKARNKEGLPYLVEKDLNEIQYANLIWGRNCTLCSKKNIKNQVDFAFRLRLCTACRKLHTIKENSAEWKAMDIHSMTRTFTPLSSVTGNSYYLPKLLRVNDKLNLTWPDDTPGEMVRQTFEYFGSQKPKDYDSEALYNWTETGNYMGVQDW